MREQVWQIFDKSRSAGFWFRSSTANMIQQAVRNYFVTGAERSGI